MNEEIKVILESLRMLLWENHRKWESINLKHGGGGGCVETNETTELIQRINNLMNPKVDVPVVEQTHDALNVEDEVNNGN